MNGKMSSKLEEYVSTVVNGGFLDPLDDSDLLEYARENIDPNCTAGIKDGKLILAFSDGSETIYDSINSPNAVTETERESIARRLAIADERIVNPNIPFSEHKSTHSVMRYLRMADAVIAMRKE